MPIFFAISRDHKPPVRMIFFPFIESSPQRTPIALSPSSNMSSTLVFSMICTPKARAPLANAIVVSIGLVCPSFSTYRLPTTPSVFTPGYSASSSWLLIIWDETPNTLAIDEVRWSSSSLSEFLANETLPMRL